MYKNKDTKRYYIVTLSAKHEDSLKQRLRDLYDYLKIHSDLSIGSLAYTLNTGRSHFHYRCAFVVSTLEDLKRSLENHLNNETALKIYNEDIDQVSLQDIIEKIDYLQFNLNGEEYRKTLQKLANLYTNGSNLDWNLLHKGDVCHRLSLPTYPFLKTRHWLRSENSSPLWHRKHYMLKEPEQQDLDWIFFYSFSVQNNILLREHIIYCQPVLPTDAWIELIYTSGFKHFKQELLLLKQFYIELPLQGVGNNTINVNQRITKLNDEVCQVVIKSRHEKGLLEQTHVRCTLSKNSYPTPDISRFDLQTERMVNNQANVFLPDHYPIQIGPFFQSVKSFSFKGNYALVDLELPKAALPYRDQFYLQPSILDGALGGVLLCAHKLANVGQQETFVPVYIEEIQIFSQLNELTYTAIIEPVLTCTTFHRFNIFLLNSKREVVLFIKELDDKRVGMELLQSNCEENINKEKIESSSNNRLDETFLITKLKELIAKTLFVDPSVLDPDKGLNEQGIDSILGMEIVKNLNQTFHLKLKGTVLYEYPTINKLKNFLTPLCVKETQEILLPKPTPPRLALRSPAEHITSLTKSISQASDIPKTAPLRSNDIAIVGIAIKFPYSDTLEELWEHLDKSEYLLEPIPRDHWDYQPYYEKKSYGQKGKIYAIQGGFIRDVDKFDPMFFNITPKDAELMDPQLRWLLQVGWAALEDAGYSQSIQGSKTGVYIGNCFNEYLETLRKNPQVMDLSRVGLGNGHSMLANRLGYFLDTKGPNMTLDTACSSSLVALHLACQAIQTGDCDAALVGGVNLSLNPSKYQTFCAMQAFSLKDELIPFDEKADGYLPGEGIAVIMLKPMQQALQDKDKVYGIIKGSAVNFAGHGSGPTVPSPEGQRAVMLEAWKKAEVSPESIGYFEAHGTGTKLGDPIEWNAIQSAFREHTKQTQFCALGTIKANIGHLEAVAGLAGVIKVLLQMRYNKIPAFPKFTELNQMIDPIQAATYINRESLEWPKNLNTPRRGVVSSYGMGGTYAHVVLEEAPVNPMSKSVAKSCYLVTLSAKHEDSLKQLIIDLSAYLTTHSQISLESISYTLNTGRTHFNYRCAMVIENLEELLNILAKLQENLVPRGCFKGQATYSLGDDAINKKILKRVLEELNNVEHEHLLAYRENIEVLASLYVKGYDLDWNHVHQNESHQKVSLPTYSFLKERYWLPNESTSPFLDIKQQKAPHHFFAPQHPLMLRNISTSERQCYEILLEPDAFYLKDHEIKGKRLLPGACYLEMARMAGTLAFPSLGVCGLKNVIWPQALSVERTKKITLSIVSTEQKVRFEIRSRAENDSDILHSEGEVVCNPIPSSSRIPKLDIVALKQSLKEEYSHEDLYAKFRSSGLSYGPSFQRLQWVKYDEQQALGYITVNQEFCENKASSAYFLHPSFLDAVLQTVIGLSFKQGKTYLPFGIEDIQWFVTEFSDTAYVLVQLESKTTEEMPRYQLQVTDEQGNVILLIKGFCARLLEEKVDKEQQKNSSSTHVAIYEPIWKEISVPFWNQYTTPVKSLLTVHVSIKECERIKEILGCEVFRFSEFDVDEPIEHLVKKVSEFSPAITHLLYFSPQENVNRVFLDVESLFTLTQAFLKSRKYTSLDGCYVGRLTESFPLASMARGFIKSLILEQPRYRYSWLLCDAKLTEAETIDLWLSEVRWGIPTGAVIRYNQNKRYEQQFQAVTLPSKTDVLLPFRKKGTYLITGGLGALGYLVARHLAVHYQANLILNGLSHLDDRKKLQIEELEKLGSHVLYVAGDISQQSEVEKLLLGGKKQFGTLHGIIHSAGILKDTLLTEKSLKDFKEVLAPKVLGLINLDNLTSNDPIEFFVMFSSIAAINGNVGQCDYASANSFMDDFAQWRQNQVIASKRSGNTLSINWPLWSEGGMQISLQTKQYLEDVWGMHPLPTITGLQLLEQILNNPRSQNIVLYGKENILAQFFNTQLQEKISTASAKLSQKQNINWKEISTEKLLETTQTYLKKLLQLKFKFPEDKIDFQTPFEQYGLDSILILDLTRELEKDFGNLPKTLFFEFRNLMELSHYFVQYHKDALNNIKSNLATHNINEDNSFLDEEKSLDIVEERYASNLSHPAQSVGHVINEATINILEEDIAIIGLSGRYPDAKNLQEFWKNLQQGHNAVREIPLERWDWRLQYDSDKSKIGKSYGKWGSFIKDFDQFDPLFFNISPREAELMDPQERLFLEVSWNTFEDAGYNPEKFSQNKESNIGVFVGVMYGPYQLHGFPLENNSPLPISSYSSISNRVSYALNLHGPSLAVDTMCSSSLSAIHLACESLRRKECLIALAGGVNITSHPSKYIMLSQGRFLSSDGLCKSFGEGGDGYVPGEGVGAVLLKPLIQAISDKDHIYAVIKGSAINHGGKTNGYTIPNPVAQSKVIHQAFTRAHIAPESLSYVEAHGTGTNLGDPIEIRGLCKVFEGIPEQTCPVGSIKSNLGHLESAAGIAALTKVLLQFKHKQLAPSIHSNVLNPHIDFEKTPFYVQQELTAWEPKNGFPRRAGISSFGAGGSNAHIILEEISKDFQQPSQQQNKPCYLICISAKHKDSLRQRITDLDTYLKIETDLPLEAIAYTLNVGRSHFAYRCAMVVSNFQELEATLESLQQDQTPLGCFRNPVQSAHEDHAIYKQVLESTLEKLKIQEIQSNVQKYREVLEALASLYVRGYDVDWELLHQGENNQRISLPGYPFLKERYWLKRQDMISVIPSGKIKLTSKVTPTSIVNKHEPSSKGLGLNLEGALNSPQIFDVNDPALMNQVSDSLNKSSSVSEHRTSQPFPINEKNILDRLQFLFKETMFLKDEQIDLNKPFAEYGLDSIIGVELIKKINQEFNLKLSAAKLYDYSTLKYLKDFLLSQIKDLESNTKQDLTPFSVPEVFPNQVIEKPIQQQQTVMDSEEGRDAVAIIGMAGLFPEADSVEEFWDNLIQGKSSIGEIPATRWPIADHYHIDHKVPNKSYSKWGAFIKDVDCFDPLFFGISPAEAEWMDPQQRLFLQVSWQAIEDSGCNPLQLDKSRCGIYVGIMNNDYSELISRTQHEFTAQQMLGNSNSILAARIAYFLNLKGPAITLDTACSSSLVAIHQACKSLQDGEVDLMLAGGVTLYLSETPYILMSKAGMLSSTGKCKTFDDGADGFVPGEGCGVVVLKRLHDALRDGDKIHGVIRGSGINQDGKTNGITAPSALSQQALLLDIYKKNNIDPRLISYVEAHGTGTALGDPIEVEALTNAFSAYSSEKQYCALGSVKSNIGHTSAAAGVTSVIKVLLMMRHKTLVPSIHYEKPNHHIDFFRTPFYVNTETKSWESRENHPLLVAVSAFGFSGTNAHVVIEEVHQHFLSKEYRKPHYVVTISGKHPKSLNQRIKDLNHYLENHSNLPLEAIAYTLNIGRAHFEYRYAFVAASYEEFKNQLEQLEKEQMPEGCFKGKVEKIIENKAIYNQVLQISTEKLKSFNFMEVQEYKELLEALANLYVKGYDLDWKVLHKGESHQKLSLPTYPFLKERYWLPNAATSIKKNHELQKELAENNPEKSGLDSNAEGIALNKDEIEKKFYAYHPQWIEQALSMEVRVPDSQENFLILGEQTSHLLSSIHQDWSERVISVRWAQNYQKQKERNYTLNASQSSDYLQLAQNLKSEGLWPDTVLHVMEPLSLSANENSSYSGVLVWLQFFQAWQRVAPESPLHYVCLYEANSLHSQPHYNAMASLSRSVKWISPQFTLSLIAVHPDIPKKPDWISCLKEELVLRQDRFVYYDATKFNSRFVRQLREIQLPDSVDSLPIRKQGVYLITGGVGEIGKYFTRYLVECYQAKVIILGRTPLRVEKSQLLEEFKAKGGEIHYISIDIGISQVALEKVVSDMSQKMGGLHGIIHSAGIVTPLMANEVSPTDFRKACQAKIDGTVHLDFATRTIPLDFFVTFSSISAELGDFGIGSYAFGNRFMDEFMQLRSSLVQQGLRHGISLSLQWPYWEEGGMHLPKEALQIYQNYAGLNLLKTEDGLSAFEQSLVLNAPTVLIAPGNKNKLKRLLGIAKSQEYISSKVELYLKTVFSEATKIPVEQLEDDEPLEHYGVDSIVMMTLTQRLTSDFPSIPKTLLFEHTTFKSLVNYFVTRHSQDVMKLFSVQQPEPSKQLLEIKKTNPQIESHVRHHFPLSLGQQQLYSMFLLDPQSTVYNVGMAIELKGDLSIDILQKALNMVVARHEVLRTRFILSNNGPKAIVEPFLVVNILLVKDPSPSLMDEQNELVNQIINKFHYQPFDLERAPLLRCQLLQLTMEHSIFMVTMHHMITDGWSVGLFTKELMQYYNGLINDSNYQAPLLAFNYRDFVELQRTTLTPEREEEILSFWQNQLAKSPTSLHLPTTSMRNLSTTYQRGVYDSFISEELTEQIKEFVKIQGVSLFVGLFSAYQVLLARYSNQFDLVVGVPFFGRQEPRFEETQGYFINTLPLRAILPDSLNFEELLQKNQVSVRQAHVHQPLPLAKLMSALKIERSLEQQPLFQVMFNLVNLPMPKPRLAGLVGRYVWTDAGQTDYDLSLEVTEEENKTLKLTMSYNASLFTERFVQQFLTHYKQLLENILSNSKQLVLSLEFMSEQEKKQLTVDWNQTWTNFPIDKTVHQLFEEQAKRTPENIAVIFENDQLTYKELNNKSYQLANYLRSQGVGPEVLVAVSLERSLESIISLLGILKAGGAFIPLDPSYPKERLQFMLDDTKAPILLTKSHLLHLFKCTECKPILLDEDWNSIVNTKQTNGLLQDQPVKMNNLAYIIYTSGSTGTPKGVMIEHASMANLVQAHIKLCALTSDDRVLQFASLGFDNSIQEIFPALIVGASLVLRPAWLLTPDEDFLAFLKNQHVTIVDLPTAFWHQWAQDIHLKRNHPEKILRLVLVGGEKVEYQYLAKWFAEPSVHSCRWLNAYGPTEATVNATTISLDSKSLLPLCEVPIGRPIDNSQIYILDAQQRIVPIGVPGEIYIGGIGVARGYLNRPDLTAERFVENPFTSEEDKKYNRNLKLYKTGDMGRYLPDGNIEYLNRIDQQIKLRGFRIELGEIENALRMQSNIRDAVVLLQEGEHNLKRLIAYVILTQQGLTKGTQRSLVYELRTALAQRLPDYMIPHEFMFLEKFPLTPSGKLNRRALPTTHADWQNVDNQYTEPHTELEKVLISIWQKVLRAPQIGIHDNFFFLGGDSILVIQVVSTARQHNLDFNARTLFEHPTVSALAKAIEQKKASSSSEAQQENKEEDIPLTPIQHWFFEQNFPFVHSRNQSVLLRPKILLDVKRLENTLRILFVRHLALRLRFEPQGKKWRQSISRSESQEPLLKRVNLSHLTEGTSTQVISEIIKTEQKKLHLTTGPLFQVVLIELKQEQRLLLIAHHLIMDAVSWRILLEDFFHIYEGHSLPSPTASYQKWSLALQKLASSENLQSYFEYWQQLSVTPDLPIEKIKYPSKQAASVLIALKVNETQQLLREITKNSQSCINDILLTALTQTFKNWTGYDGLYLTLEGHGREVIGENLDLSHSIGLFTSCFPLYLSAPQDPELALKQIKEQLQQVPLNGLSYGVLRYLLPAGDQLAKIPQPQVIFNYLGQWDNSFDENTLLELAPEFKETNFNIDNQSRTMFEITGKIIANQLYFSWNYNAHYYHRVSVEKLATEYKKNLEHLIEHYRIPKLYGNNDVGTLATSSWHITSPFGVSDVVTLHQSLMTVTSDLLPENWSN